MRKNSTLLFTYEHTFETNEVLVDDFNAGYDEMEKLLSKFGVDPPDKLVEKILSTMKV